MYKIMDLLIIERLRRWKQSVMSKPFQALGMLVAVGYFLWILPGIFAGVTNAHIKYIALAANIYFWLKIVNSTQGITVDYQLIQMKLISYQQFKCIVAVKAYGVSALLVPVVWILKNQYGIREYKWLVVCLLLNSAVNLYGFIKSKYHHAFFDLLLSVIVSVCIYTRSLWASLVLLVMISIVYWCMGKMNYEELLPLYRIVGQVGKILNGSGISQPEQQELEHETERLFGTKRKTYKEWCQSSYDNKNKFYRNREIARIYANQNTLIQYFISSCIFSFGVLYLPKWYETIVVMMQIFLSYEFCHGMCKPEKKLYEYGFVESYTIKSILKNKWLIYTVVGCFLLLPSIFVLRYYSVAIPLVAALASFTGIVQCFWRSHF